MAPSGAHTAPGRGTEQCPPGVEIRRFVFKEGRACCTEWCPQNREEVCMMMKKWCSAVYDGGMEVVLSTG